MEEPDLKGRTLADRYRIEAKLGAGGMATAWLAFDRHLSRQVVVKVPFPDLVRVESFARRFDLEIRSLIRLAHPHVVHVLDVGAVDGLPYCVLEYLGGGSLSDRLEKSGGRQGIGEVLAWLPHIAAALDHVHEEGMIHRDVKPGNILFDEKGNPALSDFGIVKACEQAREGLTATGQSPGSPGYMAPEILGGGIGPAYDQYSLAAVVYRAVSGSAPKPLQAHLGLVQTGESFLPLPAMSVLQTALSPEPGARFPTCTRFAQAFAAAAGSASSDSDIPVVLPVSSAREDATGTFMLPIPPRPQERRSSRAPWIIAALLAAALLVVGAGFAGLIPMGRGTTGGTTHTRRPDDTPPPHPAPAPRAPAEAAPDRPPPPRAAAPVRDETPPVIRMDPVAALTNRSWLALAGRVEEEHAFELRVGEEVIPTTADGEFRGGVVLREGANTVILTAVDEAGNRAETAPFEVTLDATDPVLRIEGGERQFTRAAEFVVRGTLVDAHPRSVLIDGAAVQVAADGSFSHRLTIPGGGGRFEVRGRDEAGNESEFLVLRVTVDSEAPVLAVLDPVDGLLTRSDRVEVRVRLEDDHPASMTIGGLEAANRGGSIFQAEVPIAEGRNPIELRGRDAAGNEVRGTVEVVRDTKAPGLQLEPAEVLEDRSHRIRGRMLDEHPGHVEINGVRVETGPDGAFDHTLEARWAGRKIEFRPVDRAGNPGEISFTTLPMEAPPTLIHLDAIPAATTESSVVVSGTVEPDGVTVTVNGREVPVQGGRFSCRLELPPGESLIAVAARHGNSSPTREERRIVRQRAPVKPPPAVVALIEKLRSRDPGERFFAATGLGRSGYKGAAEALEIVLRDDTDTNVRRAAARSIANLDAWLAVPTLLDTLARGERLVASDVHDALKKITGQDFGYQLGMSPAEAAAAAERGRQWWSRHQGDRAE